MRVDIDIDKKKRGKAGVYVCMYVCVERREYSGEASRGSVRADTRGGEAHGSSKKVWAGHASVDAKSREE